MISEGIRMKIALVFIGIIVLLVPLLPFTVQGDGATLYSRIQMFLGYSLGGISFLLSLLTLFLACSAIANEIRDQHIFMVVSKPIPRWQFFLGKWLGIATLNAGILFIAGLAVYLFIVLYMRHLPTSVPGDQERVANQVLTARPAQSPEPPDFEAYADQYMRALREQGGLDDLTPAVVQKRRDEALEQLKRQWRSIAPGDFMDFKFSNLIVDRESDQQLFLHIKPVSPSGVDFLPVMLRWQSGDQGEPDTVDQVWEKTDFVVDQEYDIPLRAKSVNSKGELYVKLQNLDPRNTVMFEGNESLQLLFRMGSFEGNLARGLIMIWCKLAFIAAAGLLLSTFLSFPVACLGTVLVVIVSYASGFLSEAIEAAHVRTTGEDPLWILGPLLRPVASFFVWLTPDFSAFDPVDNIVGGRLVTLMWVLKAILVLVVIKGLVLGLIGGVVLSRREVGRPTL